MEERPLVSFLVNNHNYGRFLAPLLDALLCQTYDCVEVIVVDDGSTDESREVLARYADRVRVELQERGGQASACNRAYELSRGEIVVFHDSDDLMYPDSAERLVQAFRDPSIVMTLGRLADVDADGRSMGSSRPADGCPLWGGDLRSLVLDRCLFFYPETTGQSYRRSFLDEVMPIPTALVPDLYLSHLGAIAGSVATLEKPIARYRVHGRNKGVMPANRGIDWIDERLSMRTTVHDSVRAYAREHGTFDVDRWPPRDFFMSGLDLAERTVRARPGRLRVASRGVRAVAGHPQLRARTQARHIAWFLATAVAPSRVARRLLAVEFPPGAPY